MCNVPACHGSLICGFLSFIYIFIIKKEKKKKMLFLMFSFFLIVWVKVAHVPWRNCTRSATWMVWPTGLGHLTPSYLYPGGAWRGGGCWTRKFCIVHLSPPLLRLRVVGGRGRVFALLLWACVLSVLGTGVVISWEHGPQAPSVCLVNIFC